VTGIPARTSEEATIVATQQLAQSGPRTRAHGDYPPLTPSEERVAQLVARGYTNREIADRLFVSHHTVGTHVRHIYDKLQVRSRVALTRLIIRQLALGD
jgi:DNA-binding NarL/FixJ family response regulator